MYITVIHRDTNNSPQNRAQYIVAACEKKWFENPLNRNGGKIVANSRAITIETKDRYLVGTQINPYKALGLKHANA